jgi:hypothetical protein
MYRNRRKESKLGRRKERREQVVEKKDIIMIEGEQSKRNINNPIYN